MNVLSFALLVIFRSIDLLVCLLKYFFISALNV